MKRISLILIAFTVPLLLFLSTWQSFRYVNTEKEVKKMEEQQKIWIEENKKIIASIAVLRSPERIEMIAKELGLSKIRENYVKKVQIE